MGNQNSEVISFNVSKWVAVLALVGVLATPLVTFGIWTTRLSSFEESLKRVEDTPGRIKAVEDRLTRMEDAVTQINEIKLLVKEQNMRSMYLERAIEAHLRMEPKEKNLTIIP